MWAVFAETLTYFGDRAELQLAARHERYNRAGGTTDPKIAAQFFASDWLSLRASWGHFLSGAQRVSGGRQHQFAHAYRSVPL